MRAAAAAASLVAAFAVVPAAAEFVGLGEPVASRDGLYVLVIDSEVDPPVINRMHRWHLTLSDADGQPVTGASITVDGGMPAHDHGLPTAPRVTGETAAGRYLLEGLRFHMNGEWLMSFAIDAEAGTDTVRLRLEVGP